MTDEPPHGHHDADAEDADDVADGSDAEDGTRSKHIEKLKSADAREIHRTVREEGEDELDRPAASLFWSGLAAGIAINTSLICEGALHQRLPVGNPWSELITALGYPIGFVIVILGRMQLFTESTITAMLPLVTRPSWVGARRTVRLWLVVLAANMVGSALASGSYALDLFANPDLRHAMLEVSRTNTDFTPLAVFLKAVPAGFLIAIVAWLLPNSRHQAWPVIFSIIYVIAIGTFAHSIVGSGEAFLRLFAGDAGAGAMIGGYILPAVIGNLLGGAGLFALLAHAQVRSEMPNWLKQD